MTYPSVRILTLALFVMLCGCSGSTDEAPAEDGPDLILTNARVYTMTWQEPAGCTEIWGRLATGRKRCCR